MSLDGERYTYRTDPRVPAFDDTPPILFMDGDCALCTRGARVIARFDRTGVFRFCRTQSPLGRAVLGHYGFDPDDPESWLYLTDGRAYSSLDAMIRVALRLGGIMRVFAVFRILPGPLQDWLYRRIARNRYALFGRTDMCTVPDPALRSRLLE